MVPDLREREPHVAGERLGAFVDGELQPDQAEAVRHHLATCPTCRTDAEVLARAGTLLRQAVAAEPAPDPEAVWQGVRRRLQAQTPAGGPVPSRRLLVPLAWLAWPRTVTWAAAAVVLATGLALLQTRDWLAPSRELTPLPPPSLAGGPPAVVEALEGGGGATVMLYAPPESPVPIIWVFEPEPMEAPDAPPAAGTT
ncbi:MAG TPA: zf-HC2 domain-containing protein [Candidatus Methylomirabilis sp.]|nr:zf-HC2 domain-containing protein [Candidatus Methylomirabilis sp.]